MSSNGSLGTRYGREVKVYEIIQEYGKNYFGLFYRSTGTGNPQFKGKFADTLVPFYGMEKDTKTITKAVLIRNEVYGELTFFTWQLELLQYLSTKTDSVMLRDILTLLDNYFNTSGEILISINDGKGFWARNTNITSEIIKFFKEKKIESNGVEVPEDAKLKYEKDLKTNWTQSAEILVKQEQSLKKNWKKSAQILVKQEQEERLAQKFAAIRLRKEKKKQEETMAAIRLRKEKKEQEDKEEHPDAQRTSGGRRKRSSKTRRSMRKGNKKKRVKTRRRK